MQVPPLRLSTPYRPEADAAASALARLQDGRSSFDFAALRSGRTEEDARHGRTAQGERVSLDWSRVAAQARPWIEGVRNTPAPFWALESLLTEYPISSAEGTALMRLAEALLRVPDRDTAIALTADQLGRANFGAHSGRGLAAMSARALALAKSLLPEGGDAAPGPMRRLGGEAVVTIALRAVQLLGRQFVLGEQIGEAMARAEEWRVGNSNFRFS